MTTATLAAPSEDASSPPGTRTEAPPVEADGDPPPAARGVGSRLRGRLAQRVGPADAGMATAEYAIATVAAAGFAGLLLVILRSGEVRELLLGIVRGALQV